MDMVNINPVCPALEHANKMLVKLMYVYWPPGYVLRIISTRTLCHFQLGNWQLRSIHCTVRHVNHIQ